MAKPRYDDLLQEEERIEERLKNRNERTGTTKGGVPIERDKSVKETTALRARQKALREEKDKYKAGLDPLERTAHDLYEEFLKQRRRSSTKN